MSFASDIAKFAQKTGQKIDRAIVSACYQISEAIVSITPVDKGTAKGNWIPTVNNPSSAILDIQDKTGNATLAKIRSVTMNAPGNIYYLVNNLPYIRVLEYGLYGTGQGATYKTAGTGYSIQAPQGMVRINVQNFQAALRKAVQDVN
jgi:hypothetical protein